MLSIGSICISLISVILAYVAIRKILTNEKLKTIKDSVIEVEQTVEASISDINAAIKSNDPIGEKIKDIAHEVVEVTDSIIENVDENKETIMEVVTVVSAVIKK